MVDAGMAVESRTHLPRTYVVTGSASGIGRATCALLEARGARVIGVDIHGAKITADLATPDGRKAMIHEVAAASGGSIDAVIACAGVSDRKLSLHVNYFGAVATLDGLRPLLARGKEPRAVAVSSYVLVVAPGNHECIEACLAGDEEKASTLISTEPGGPYDASPYPISKRALARWIRREAPLPQWAGLGIALNAVAPGIIHTPMTQHLKQDEQRRKDVAKMTPMQWHPEGAEPESIARLLIWLASPENGIVTGQILFADGGAEAVRRGQDIW